MENIAGHAINASDFLQKRVVKNFSQADPEYGRAIQEKLDQLKAQKKAKVSLEVKVKKLYHGYERFCHGSWIMELGCVKV